MEYRPLRPKHIGKEAEYAKGKKNSVREMALHDL